MKDIQLFCGLLLLSILFISTQSVKIYYIADGLTNSTACVVFLESEEIKDNFVYLGFDFVFHGEISPHSKDYALFNIEGNIASIKYAFTEKESYTIDNVDDIKEWKDIDFVNNIGVDRTDNKMKTLLFKVFIKEKSGEILAENIPSPGGDDINESINESKAQTDLTTQSAHTDKIEQSDKPKPPEPLKTDKIDQSDSTNSDSNPEKSLTDKIKDIIKNIIDLIKRLFGLI